MLTRFETYRRLRAYAEGRPLPRGSTRHLPIARGVDSLIVAFVKMGGESSPWGIAWGAPGAHPQIQTVAEPRDRDAVASLAMAFAPGLLAHLAHPYYGDGEGYDKSHPAPLRQVWLPNPAHVDMLHFLDFAYTRTKARGQEERELLRALGRGAGWLFRKSRRPGQVVVASATDALRTAFTFPAEDARQAHLGYLLAWLETRGDRDARMARAGEAERSAVGTALDPALERDALEKRVDAFNRAEKAGDMRGQGRAEREIEAILSAELTRRFEQVGRAIRLLRADPRPVNPGVATLVAASGGEHWFQYLRHERVKFDAEDGPIFTPGSETDHHPSAAAARFFVTEASQAVFESVLVHHDAELQAEAIAEGRAVRGKIVEVWDEGEGKSTRPVWVIESSGPPPTRLREGTELCVAGLPQRTLLVREIADGENGRWRIEVEVEGCKTRPRGVGPEVPVAADHRLKRTAVTLLPKIRDGISRLKSRRIWRKDQPGSAITRGIQPEVLAAIDSDREVEIVEVEAALREQGS